MRTAAHLGVGELHADADVGCGGADGEVAPVRTHLARRAAARITPEEVGRRVGARPDIGFCVSAREEAAERVVLTRARRPSSAHGVLEIGHVVEERFGVVALEIGRDQEVVFLR